MQVAALLKQTLNAVRRAAAHHPRTYWAFQIAFLGWSVYWWRFPPDPGKAVLLLGVVATIVTIQPEMTDNHRLVWLVIVFVLFWVESKAINRDRADALAREKTSRAEENAKFGAVIEAERKHFEATLAENQREFAETMRRSDQIIGGVADSVKMQTGGDSFAYITLTGPQSPILTLDKFSHPSGPWFLVAITSHGKYPLRNVHATMMDDEARLVAMQEYSKHPQGDWLQTLQAGLTEYQYLYLRPQSPEAPSGDVQAIGSYPIPAGTSKRLHIAFSSLNGYWNEVLHLGLVNEKWHQCLSILGPTMKQVARPFVWCDSDWPEGKALAEKDWARVTPPVRKQ